MTSTWILKVPVVNYAIAPTLHASELADLVPSDIILE